MDTKGSEEQRLRILVVEDDVTLCRMVARMLGPMGEVRMANDGLEALRMVRLEFMPDVVVTDVMMPNMDGFSLTKRLKGDPVTQHIPVVMLTAKDRPGDLVDGINAGARHYVTKPFKRETLVTKVKRALNIK